MSKTNRFEILGVATPLMDQILQVDEEFLKKIPGKKGGMESVDYDTLCQIVRETGKVPQFIPGGSGSNTVKGLAKLGHPCGLVGKIGRDVIGQHFLDSLKNMPITPLYVETNTPSAQVVCLVTPDSERTGRSFLGASREMRPSDLNPDIFQNTKLVHIEGYTLLNEGVVERAMELAKKAGAKVSFDLASFEIVQTYREEIQELLPRYVDILFANADETRTLTNLDPEEGCDVISEHCEIAVVLVGKDGCWVRSHNEKIHCPAFPIEPIDTTGAGDLFASGFLHGYLEKRPLKECGQWGCLVAAEVVQVVGAEIPEAGWLKIKTFLEEFFP